MADSTVQVAIMMESQSDWDTMRLTSEMLTRLHILHECRILSTPRSPKVLVEYMQTSEARGVRVFIAGAGGAAPLAGVLAANTSWPVLGVPMPSKAFCGLDSLLAVVQMPKGLPVGTLAIGDAGAVNAALLAAAILALTDASLSQRLQAVRTDQTNAVLAARLPEPAEKSQEDSATTS
jgi:5-(carboxyamino)imidazole ribonucleotide mutase